MKLFAVEIKVHVNSSIEIWLLITKTMSQTDGLLFSSFHKLYSIHLNLHLKG